MRTILHSREAVSGRTPGLAVAMAVAVACATLALAGEPEDAVRAAVEKLVAADNATDLEGVLASYVEDAVLLPPDGPAVHGKEAIEPRYRELFEAFSVELEMTIEELEAADDWAWCRGTTAGRFTPRGDGAAAPARVVDDKFLMVLARGGDGLWRVHTLMWSPHRSTAGG